MTTFRCEVDVDEMELTEESIKLIRSSGVSLDADGADALRALTKTDELKLFCSENTAGKQMLILAKTACYARHIALRAGHIQAIDNGQCFAANQANTRVSSGFLSAVQRAAADRVPGVIEAKGNFAAMGELIYSPISVVR